MRPATIKTQVSSGGVIFRTYNKTTEIALVVVKGGDVWCLPKGVVNRGEDIEKTALREVAEETGLRGRIIEKLGEITYWYYIKDENTKCRKTVHFFLMGYEGGEISRHDWEVDNAYWFPIDDAINKVRYKGDREIIEKARKIIEKGKSVNG